MVIITTVELFRAIIPAIFAYRSFPSPFQPRVYMDYGTRQEKPPLNHSHCTRLAVPKTLFSFPLPLSPGWKYSRLKKTSKRQGNASMVKAIILPNFFWREVFPWHFKDSFEKTAPVCLMLIVSRLRRASLSEQVYIHNVRLWTQWQLNFLNA